MRTSVPKLLVRLFRLIILISALLFLLNTLYENSVRMSPDAIPEGGKELYERYLASVIDTDIGGSAYQPAITEPLDNEIDIDISRIGDKQEPDIINTVHQPVHDPFLEEMQRDIDRFLAKPDIFPLLADIEEDTEESQSNNDFDVDEVSFYEIATTTTKPTTTTLPIQTTQAAPKNKPVAADVYIPKDTTKETTKSPPMQTPSIKTKGGSGVKYLFPLIFLQGSPTFYYSNYKVALFYAKMTQRTIVTPPFANHYGHPDKQFWWNFNDTFDVTVLQQLMPTISTEEFNYLCGGSVDLLLMNPYTLRNNNTALIFEDAYNKTIKMLSLLTDIELPTWEERPQTAKEVRQRYDNANDARCVCMYRPFDFRKIIKDEVLPAKRKLVTFKIDRHLVRTPQIKQRVDVILQHVCNGKPYLALHWRNRSGEVCELRLRNYETYYSNCDEIIKFIRTASKQMVPGLKSIMDENKLSCIYVSHPYYSAAIVKTLKTGIKNVYSSHDIIALNIPAVDRLQTDNYILSLVEQEIMSRGALFIASHNSPWSEFVMDERFVSGKPTLFLNKVPGTTKELVKLI